MFCEHCEGCTVLTCTARSSLVLVSHDDGSTELVSVQDTSEPHISTYKELEEGEGPHLLIETLPNTPCPSLSPPPVERLSEDSLEDRDSSGLQTCSSPPQSLPAIREANRQSYKQKLNSLNSHLEMVDFSGGDVVSDKVQCFIYCSTTCHAHSRKVLIRKVS